MSVFDTNAFEELHNLLTIDLKLFSDISIGYVQFGDEFLYLKENYTEQDMYNFIQKLKNINYNTSSASEPIKSEGYLIFKDGTWYQRFCEQDGNQWWELMDLLEVRDLIDEVIKDRKL
ncbi:hypothetical protein [Oceanotoga phage vB_OteS-UFV02]